MKKVFLAICVIATLGLLNVTSVSAKAGPDAPSWSQMLPGLKLYAMKNGQVDVVKGKSMYTFIKDTMGRSVALTMEMTSDSHDAEMKMLTIASRDIGTGRTTMIYVTPDGRAIMR